MAEVVKLGSLYIGGRLQESIVQYTRGKIFIGPTVPGAEIRWIKVNGLLIADRCLCTTISWEHLDAQGLVFGTMVRLNDCWYICRCLEVGSEDYRRSEWSDAVKATSDRDELWHWSGFLFWGQERVLDRCAACRGMDSAMFWDYGFTGEQHPWIGWRPVLEPMGRKTRSPEAMLGKPVKLFGPNMIPLSGTVLEVDDYDVLVKPKTELPKDWAWGKKADDGVLIDKNSIAWIKAV